MKAQTASIAKQVTRGKGELAVSQPKARHSIRVLPVPAAGGGVAGGGAQEVPGKSLHALVTQNGQAMGLKIFFQITPIVY